MDTLRTMICGELDDIAKKGTLSHETLDILKDLLESAKNLEKIDKYQREKEEEEMVGYSQRKYYIDADYQPGMGGNSYARGGRAMYDMNSPYTRGGNSYGRGMYDMGNSYNYYDSRYENPMYSMARGYSRTSSKEEMIEELKQMMAETGDEKIRSAISEAIGKMNK